MSIFVLPTAIIVRQFREYEYLFSFYQEGVKGVVKDIFLCNGTEAQLTNTKNRIVEEYELNLQIRYYENTHNRLSFEQMLLFTLEYVLENIEEELNKLMRLLFNYTFCYIDRRAWRWMGDDLMVDISHG